MKHYSFFLRLCIFVGLATNVMPIFAAKTPVDNKLKADMDQLYNDMKASQAEMQKEAAGFKDEAKKLEAVLNEEDAITSFTKTALISSNPVQMNLPTLNFNSGYWEAHRQHNVRFQFDGKDLIKFGSLLTHGGIEYVFYRYLSDHFISSITNTILANKKELILLLENVQILGKNDFLIDFFKKECVPDFAYTQHLSLKLLWYLSLLVGSHHTVESLKDDMLTKPGGGLLKRFEESEKEAADALKDPKAIPTRTLLFPLLYLIIGHKPDFDDVAPLLPLFFRPDDVKGLHGAKTFFPLLNALVKGQLGSMGKYYEFINTGWVPVIKQFLVLIRFLKQTHTNFQNGCIQLLKDKSQDLLVLLKTTSDDQAASEQQIKKSLKKLIQDNSSASSFVRWYYFKKRNCWWTSLWIDLALNIPIGIKIGQTIAQERLV